MKVSIITINYNNSEGLERTLKSVRSQSYSDYEHVVIDGGSKDNSVDIIKSYEDHLSFWVSEPDGGIYNAMNKGVANSNGEYCLFLNSGDVLCDNNSLLRICSNEFYEDVVAANLMVDNSVKGANIPPDRISLEYLLASSLPHPSTLIKRDLLVALPYKENYKIVSDWIFFFEALVINCKSFRHVNDYLSVFYTDGISGNKQKARAEQVQFLNEIYGDVFIRFIEDSYTRAFISSTFLKPFLKKTLHVLIKIFLHINQLF